jgi:hypothetical protein
MKLLEELLQDQSEIFQKEPDRAAKLFSVGDSKFDGALDTNELAATTELAQAVLNLDATIWER